MKGKRVEMEDLGWPRFLFIGHSDSGLKVNVQDN